MTNPLEKESSSIRRNDFIRRWMEECGVTYDVASQIYRTMVATFEDGVANGQKVIIGQLGALVPYWQGSRTAVMGFKRVPGGVIHQKQEYFLDPRIKYRFKLYRQWVNKSHLNWSR